MDRLFVALLSESTRLGIVDVLCVSVIIAGGGTVCACSFQKITTSCF